MPAIRFLFYFIFSFPRTAPRDAEGLRVPPPAPLPPLFQPRKKNNTNFKRKEPLVPEARVARPCRGLGPWTGEPRVGTQGRGGSSPLSPLPPCPASHGMLSVELPLPAKRMGEMCEKAPAEAIPAAISDNQALY